MMIISQYPDFTTEGNVKCDMVSIEPTHRNKPAEPTCNPWLNYRKIRFLTWRAFRSKIIRNFQYNKSVLIQVVLGDKWKLLTIPFWMY